MAGYMHDHAAPFETTVCDQCRQHFLHQRAVVTPDRSPAQVFRCRAEPIGMIVMPVSDRRDDLVEQG